MSLILRGRNNTIQSEPPVEIKDIVKTDLDDIGRLIRSAAWGIRWDYNGWKKCRDSGFAPVFKNRDWTQTLMIKINQISAQIHKATLRGGADRIIIHPKLLPIIEELEYYNEGDMSIGSRFKIMLDERMHPNKMLLASVPKVDIPLEKNVYTGEVVGVGVKCGSDYEKLISNNRLMGVIQVDGLGVLDVMEEVEEIVEVKSELNRRLLLLSK